MRNEPLHLTLSVTSLHLVGYWPFFHQAYICKYCPVRKRHCDFNKKGEQETGASSELRILYGHCIDSMKEKKPAALQKINCCPLKWFMFPWLFVASD